MDKKNQVTTIVVSVLVAVGIGFFGGMQYQATKKSQSQIGQRNTNGGGTNGGQRGQGQGGFQRQGGGIGDFAGGQIISKDDSSMTIKARNGATQIIFISSSTSIDKSVSGSISDLSVGQQITANGKTNPDGSLAAQNIQIRSAQIQPQVQN